MPYQPGQGKTAVGLFVDGLELKMVQLSLKGSRVMLRDFKAVSLVKKFEEKQAAASAADEASFAEAPAADAFAAAPSAEAPTEEGSSNASVLLGVLGDLPSAKYTVSFALSEPAVSYHEFDSDFGLSGTKLKKQVIQELSANRPSPPALDAVEIIPTASAGILSVIREDGLQLYDLLTELRSFLGGRIPNVKSIDSADVALMELVRSNYELQEEEVTVIVYVGHDFSRLIFMQSNNFLHFAPIISEGLGSANIENTLYSRVLLEQDNIALSRIDRILLAGEGHKLNLRDALAPQFSSAQVEYIKAPNLDLSLYEGSVGEAISEYSIPIITAWKALLEKQQGFYPTNLVPVSILEGQKAFKLAWHGWLAAALIVVSIVFFYTSILKRHGEIVKAEVELNQKKSRLGELEALRVQRDKLKADIQRYSAAGTLYEKIAPGGDRWSRILHYLANSVEDLNSLWIRNIRPVQNAPGVFMITGRSIYRTRIPRLANIFEKATLKEVRTTEIRKKIIYEFDIQVDKVDKTDAPYVPESRGKK
ncbi:MAG: hypothetical protein HY562_00645 [Ignavibacteriales bacterium]|nr:hypothetical protein [Ignavibacteriales bacterium]